MQNNETMATVHAGSTHIQEHTGCCIMGAGPAEVTLALLLVRQGIEVTLLEAHLDFAAIPSIPQPWRF
jgi:ribulose 1,5-bisphosphate synthetase/thiazole synthase